MSVSSAPCAQALARICSETSESHSCAPHCAVTSLLIANLSGAPRQLVRFLPAFSLLATMVTQVTTCSCMQERVQSACRTAASALWPLREIAAGGRLRLPGEKPPPGFFQGTRARHNEVWQGGQKATRSRALSKPPLSRKLLVVQVHELRPRVDSAGFRHALMPFFLVVHAVPFRQGKQLRHPSRVFQTLPPAFVHTLLNGFVTCAHINEYGSDARCIQHRRRGQNGRRSTWTTRRCASCFLGYTLDCRLSLSAAIALAARSLSAADTLAAWTSLRAPAYKSLITKHCWLSGSLKDLINKSIRKAEAACGSNALHR